MPNDKKLIHSNILKYAVEINERALVGITLASECHREAELSLDGCNF